MTNLESFKKELAYKLLLEFEITASGYAKTIKDNDIDSLYWLGRKSAIITTAYAMFGENIYGLSEQDFINNLRGIVKIF
jgi:hypothetical protein